MKKLFIPLILIGFALGMLASCGEAYKPMTPEQLEAKVDSLYQVKAAELSADLAAKCDSALEDHVKARMEELRNQ